MTQLVKYEAACRAVAEAASIDEAKDFRDKSEAMRAYAKQAKNKQLEVQSAEIRIRAERRIGELMAAQRDAGALSEGGRPSHKTGSQTDPVSAAAIRPRARGGVGAGFGTTRTSHRFACG